VTHIILKTPHSVNVKIALGCDREK